MKKRFSVGAMATMWFFGFAVALLCCTLLFAQKYGGPKAFPYVTKFATIYQALNERYVGDLDMEEACDYAYYAMVAATGDRYSRYMTAEEYEEYRLFQQNSYKGIGVTVQNSPDNNSYPLVAALVEDSPAQQAGVRIGDFMASIDGSSLKGMTAADIKKLIEERRDTEFELTVLRSGAEQTLKISVGTVESNPVEYEMLENKIGYIRIKNFEQRAGAGIVSAADALAAQGAQGLVLDVRYNPGGQLAELIIALDHLLPEGDIFISANEDGEQTVTTSDKDFVDLPLAVLIDENSYSAAEFFAAALKEYQRALLVGQHTTGKSRSQINILLSDGSCLHLSVNRYLTPNRVDLTEVGGLVPDVESTISEGLLPYLWAGELDYSEDEPLKAAVDYLVGE